MTEGSKVSVDISLLVCTYNRSDDLRELLDSALAQKTGGAFTFEVVVVDNNSSDGTRELVQSFISKGHTNLRYFFEGKQGKSHALNTGLAAVRGWAYVIADDDFILPANWVRGIFDGFRTYPEVSFVSGKVLPLWEAEPPAWLTKEHWSAVAMADYGDKEFITDSDNQICLLACAFKVEDVQAVGGYHSDLGPQKGRTGATEDLDLLLRLWNSGRKGLYMPHLSFYHKATADRLTKKYHRRWHRDHGRSYAVMRAPETEQAGIRLFDVPGYMCRAAATDAVHWLGFMLRGRSDEAFHYETQMRFFAGFVRKRVADFFANAPSGDGVKPAGFRFFKSKDEMNKPAKQSN